MSPVLAAADCATAHGRAFSAVRALADRTLHLPGRLGAHQECGRELAVRLD